MLPFNVLCLLGIGAWDASAIDSARVLADQVVFGGVVLLFGLCTALGRFVVKDRAKPRTAYALTDQRALVAGPDGATRELDWRAMPWKARRHRDGEE